MPEEVLNIGSSSSLSYLLSSNSPGAVLSVEKAFGVKINIRDTRLKVIADDITSLRRALDFFSELASIKNDGVQVEGELFKRLLKVCSSCRESEIRAMFSEKIKVGRKKEDVIPKTSTQLEYIRAIRQKDIVFGVGPAGTGNTYLAMAMAVSEFLSGRFSRIILTRPAREAGENLGFLPGTLEEKIMPYLRPLYDALYDMLDFEEVSKLMEKRIIEVAPLAFMRGRTLNHSFIILDEAQNTSGEQMLMFLTRIGFESKCVITGDPSQTDLEKGKVSGLKSAYKKLSGIREIAFINFSSKDAVRHPLVEKIIEAYSKGVSDDHFGGKLR